MASVAKREWDHRGEVKSAWVVRYTDHGGKRRMKTFDKKKEADKYRLKVESEIERGEHVANDDALTVLKICDLYLKQCENRVRAGDGGRVWYRTVQGVINNHITPRLGARPMHELTFREIEDWHGHMLTKLAPITAKQNICILKQVETFARKRGFVKKPVVGDVSHDIGHVKYRTIKTFTLDQVRHLVELIETCEKGHRVRGHLFTKCCVQLAAFCGLRHGEIVGLTLASVDLESGFLKIRNSLTILDELKGPKTKAGNRDVPMPVKVQQCLKEWLDTYYVANERHLVFRMPDGSEITRANFHLNYWRPLLRRAGLFDKKEVIHFHALRHFAASLMIELGLPLTDVASLLGHEKFDMTLQVYAHPIVGGNRRREAFERISSAIVSGRDKGTTMASNLLM